MARIAIVCFEGVTDIDVFLHWDILNRPRTMFPIDSEEWNVSLLGTKSEHTTQAGLVVPMHGDVSKCRDFDVVLHASGQATRTLMNDLDYLESLSLSLDHQIVASQCSGALILAASGCLDGLTATTYPTARKDLESFGVEFLDSPFIEHERVATAAGCLAGVFLDAWVLSKFIEPDRVTACTSSAQPWGSGLERLI